MSMKAILLKEHGGPERLVYGDCERPALAPDEVLVRVQATSVNRADTVLRCGYPGLTVPLPHILGGDIAGVIEQVSPGVTGWGPGDRVVCYPMVLDDGYDGDDFWRVGWQYFGMHRKGAYADFVNVPASSLVPLPDPVPFEAAACLPVAALTAEHALNVGELAAGQTLFFWGGSGGLGTLLIQLAKRRGVHVITTASTPEKLKLLEALGADHVFNHRDDDVAARVRQVAPAGVDAVLDYVGPATYARSFGVLKKGGVILWCGMITGREVAVNIQALYLKHASIRGFYLGTIGELRTVVAALADRSLRPHIHAIMPLADAARAHALMDSGSYAGKIVLIP
jgi:NADPH:quinone reductase-like Zn-dependent oxidoreductase